MKYLRLYYCSFFVFYPLLVIVLWGCSNQDLLNSDEKDNLIIENQQIIEAIYQEKENLNLCDQENDQELSLDSAKVYLIETNQYLVEFLCFLGAYQPNYQYFVVTFNSFNSLENNNEIKPIIFPTFKKDKQNLKLINTRTLTGVTNLDWETKQLIIETKGRSLGDCGSFAIYKWSNYNFNLQEFRYKDDCNGVYLDPQDYPIIYP